MSVRHAVLLGLALGAAGCADDPIVAPDASMLVGDALPIPDADSADIGFAPDADVGFPDVGFIDGGTICDETPVATVTATAIADRAAILDGQLVVITGELVANEPRCTDIACPPDNPCCNTCSATLRIGPAMVTPSDCFAAAGCTGTTCAIVCRPPTIGLPGRYRGILRAGDPVTFELIRQE